MAYPPIALANTLIDRHAPSGGITQRRIQRLCYLIYGWSIPIIGKPLLTEPPEMGHSGPVFSRLQEQLARYGNERICEPLRARPFETAYPSIPVDDRISHELLTWVADRYQPFSEDQLSAIVLSTNSPWRQVAEDHHFMVPEHLEIPDAVIAHHFTMQAQQAAII